MIERVAVDVGANDGLFNSRTIQLEEMGWRVICVEANPECEEVLRRNRKEVVMAAASNWNGTGKFTIISSRYGINASGSALTPHRKHDSGKLASVNVEVLTLDSILVRQKISRVDALYIDVEGEELNVLKGLSQNPPLIWVEMNNERELHRYLDQRGYKLVTRDHHDGLWVLK